MATDFETTVLLRLGELKAGLESLEHELIGNGQPGRVQRIEKTQAEQNERLDNHDRIFISAKARVSLLAGIVAALVTIGGYFLDNIWTQYQQRYAKQHVIEQQATSSKQN
jgi:hypothetical protein